MITRLPNYPRSIKQRAIVKKSFQEKIQTSLETQKPTRPTGEPLSKIEALVEVLTQITPGYEAQERGCIPLVLLQPTSAYHKSQHCLFRLGENTGCGRTLSQQFWHQVSLVGRYPECQRPGNHPFTIPEQPYDTGFFLLFSMTIGTG